MPEFYEGKEFCLFHLLLYCLALEESQVHDSLKYLLNENHFSLFKAYAEMLANCGVIFLLGFC